MQFVQQGEFQLGFQQMIGKLEGCPDWRVKDETEIREIIDVIRKAMF